MILEEETGSGVGDKAPGLHAQRLLFEHWPLVKPARNAHRAAPRIAVVLHVLRGVAEHDL